MEMHDEIEVKNLNQELPKQTMDANITSNAYIQTLLCGQYK